MPARRLATKVKEERGSYKKDPQRKNHREPPSSKSEPTMPRHLCKAAKKIWRQTCDILREMFEEGELRDFLAGKNIPMEQQADA